MFTHLFISILSCLNSDFNLNRARYEYTEFVKGEEWFWAIIGQMFPPKCRHLICSFQIKEMVHPLTPLVHEFMSVQ